MNFTVIFATFLLFAHLSIADPTLSKDSTSQKSWNLHKEISINKETSHSGNKDSTHKKNWNLHKDVSINKEISHSSNQGDHHQIHNNHELHVHSHHSHGLGLGGGHHSQLDISINKQHSHSNALDLKARLEAKKQAILERKKQALAAMKAKLEAKKHSHGINVNIESNKEISLGHSKHTASDLKSKFEAQKEGRLDISVNHQSNLVGGHNLDHQKDVNIGLQHSKEHNDNGGLIWGKVKVDVSGGHNLGSVLHGAVNQASNVLGKIESVKHDAINSALNVAGKVKGKIESAGNTVLNAAHKVNDKIGAIKQGTLDTVKDVSTGLKQLDSQKQAHLDVEVNKQSSTSGSSGHNSQLGGNVHLDVSSSHGSEGSLNSGSSSSSHVNVHGGVQSGLHLGPSSVIKISEPHGLTHHGVKDISAKFEHQNDVKSSNVHNIAAQFEHKNEGSSNNVHHVVSQIELQNKVPSNNVKEISGKFEYQSKPHTENVKDAVAHLEAQNQHANSHKVGELAVKFEDKHHLGSLNQHSSFGHGNSGINIGLDGSSSSHSSQHSQASGHGSSNINVGISGTHHGGTSINWNHHKEVSGNVGSNHHSQSGHLTESEKKVNVGVNVQKNKHHFAGSLGGVFSSVLNSAKEVGQNIKNSIPTLGLSVGGSVNIDKNSHKHEAQLSSDTNLQHEHSSNLNQGIHQHLSHSSSSHAHSSSHKTSEASSHKGGQFNLDISTG